MDQGRRSNGTFAKGVSGNPTGRPRRDEGQKRSDGYVNAFLGHGTSRDRRIVTTHATCNVTDLQALDLRRGNWLAARVCELIDSEAFRRGYELKLDDKEEAEAVMKAAEKLCVNRWTRDAGQMERTCGGAALFPVLEGALGDLSTPLELEDGPRIATITAIHLLEPRELIPVDWYTDVRDPKFRRPSVYRLSPLSGGGAQFVGTQLIHESRLAIYPGVRMTVQSMAGQRLGWGDNVLNRVAEVLADFGLSWGSAATILHNYSQRVVKYKGLMDMLRQEGGEALIQKRVAAMDMVANALRAVPLDAEDDLVNVTTTVSGLPDLLIQFAQLISAAADMPMTRLFGMSPAGMNATGEHDAEGWYERVGARQDDHTHHVEWLLRLIMLSADGPTGGKEPEVWSAEWRPLREPSEKEDAETRKLTSEADKNWYDIGAASSDDIAKSRFGGDTFSRETTVDWKAREAQKKIDAQQAAQLDAQAIAALGRKPAAHAAEPAPPEPKPR